METFYGRDNVYSGKVSAKYIEINNFGYYKKVDTEIRVCREDGRPDYQLIYVKNGEVVLSVNECTKKVYSETIILFRPFEKQIYSYIPSVNSEYLWIHFSGTGVEELLSGLFDDNQILMLDNAFEFSDAFENIKSFCIKYDDVAAQFASGIFIKMAAELKRRINSSDIAIEKVIETMRMEGFDSHCIDDYANMCSISKYHFIRRFRAFTGMSPHKYKTKLVIDRGVDLLRSTNMNVSEIASVLGFEDSLYFSRVFKKTMGVSPIVYRQHIK